MAGISTKLAPFSVLFSLTCVSCSLVGLCVQLHSLAGSPKLLSVTDESETLRCVDKCVMQVGHYSFVIIKSTEMFWDVYVILVFVVFGFYCTSVLACCLSLVWCLTSHRLCGCGLFL